MSHPLRVSPWLSKPAVLPLCQVALMYRGRAIPVAWKVKRQPSASVAFRAYRSVLAQSVSRLKGFEVILLADRGFCHLQLLRWIKRTPDWHCRIRMKRFCAGLAMERRRLPPAEVARGRRPGVLLPHCLSLEGA